MQYENGRRLYEIPPNGVLLTQFKEETGITNREYYYQDTTGKRLPLTKLSDHAIGNNDTIGIYRDGTVGIYGNSSDPKSLPYQEFYVTNSREFEFYFTSQYQKEFDDRVRKATGYDF